jgi:hypothetical protein
MTAPSAPLPEDWNKADHHASCRPSDSSLVWQCGQCGHVAAADDIDARLQDEIAKRGSAERDYEACRELLSVHNLGGMTDYNDGPMKRALAAESRAAALQAKIDALMLEYCPNEMTPEQIDEWGRHQVGISPDEGVVDSRAALSKESPE